MQALAHKVQGRDSRPTNSRVITAAGPISETTRDTRGSVIPQPPGRKLITFRRSSTIAILDFDGTLTEVEKEGAAFVRAYMHGLGALLKTKDIERLWAEAETERASRPEDFAWNNNGFLVAPASDPYIRSQAVLDLILDKLGLIPDFGERTRVKDRLFEDSYKQSFRHNRENNINAFKKGVNEFLEELIDRMRVVIVTNSRTDAVQAKLEQLNPSILDKVALEGNARKNVINPSWEFVPEGQTVEGLDRLVLLRRKMYLDVLLKISNEFNVPIGSMKFLGDIYDLDLVLPQHLGASTALITREHTFSYETRIARNVVHDFEGARLFFGV
jgi:FMN phosphatase YigB (HAD superfamily)